MQNRPPSLPDGETGGWIARRREGYGLAHKVAATTAAQCKPAAGGALEAPKKNMVSAAISVMRLLARSDRPIGVNALARELDMAPSTCFKVLSLLRQEECVDIDEETKTYSLGAGAIMIARSALDPSGAFSVVSSRLEHMAEELALAIGLWRIVPGEKMILIGYVDAPGDVRVQLRVGQRLPMFTGALGRAIAAQMNLAPRDLEREFAAVRWDNPPTFAEYLDGVEKARRDGYAYDLGNFAPALTTVAAIIDDGTGRPHYGLSAVSLKRRGREIDVAQVGSAICETARWAARRLFAGVSQS
jgi:DNA-binding IclR family transcriptional regulator